MASSSFTLVPAMRRVENAAQRAINKCLVTRPKEDLVLPVPVERWVESKLGFALEVGDLSSLGDGVLGAAFATEKRIQISETLVHQDSRFRFTLAHELGHMILHSKLSRFFADTERTSDYLETRVEKEADRFAAAFLMPATAVAEHCQMVACSFGQDAPSLFSASHQLDTRAVHNLRTVLIPQLSRTFQVSFSAALLRFRDLLLPSGSPLLTEATRAALLAGMSPHPTS